MTARETLLARTRWIRNAVPPGFDGAPLELVGRLIVKGLFGRGVLVTRASSIAFNMLMAFLPATIFLFTLIPFIPVPNFQTELIRLFENMLPANAYSYLESTIVDVITNKSGTLMVIMFCMGLTLTIPDLKLVARRPWPIAIGVIEGTCRRLSSVRVGQGRRCYLCEGVRATTWVTG